MDNCSEQDLGIIDIENKLIVKKNPEDICGGNSSFVSRVLKRDNCNDCIEFQPND